MTKSLLVVTEEKRFLTEPEKRVPFANYPLSEVEVLNELTASRVSTRSAEKVTD